MGKTFISKTNKLHIRKILIVVAVFLLVTGNLLSALPNHMHAEDNTEVTEKADTTCSAPVALINGSFEQGAARGSAHDGSGLYYLESEVPGWKTTDKAIEIWNYKENIPAVAKNWPAPLMGIDGRN